MAGRIVVGVDGSAHGRHALRFALSEAALRGANDKFRRRFVKMESDVRKRGLQLQDAGPDLMNQLWEQAKAAPRE